MTCQLSISISDPGISERAHWGFTIHKAPNDFGDLLQCAPNRHRHVQRAQVGSILEGEKPPVGVGKCQDWVVDALVALEVEELVPDGTAAWSGRIGKETGFVRAGVGGDWVALNGR
ncbi:hypothetical protein BJX76DRAFT_363087 [Aspergillus varians]